MSLFDEVVKNKQCVYRVVGSKPDFGTMPLSLHFSIGIFFFFAFF